MKNVIVRSISGIIYVALIVAATLLGWQYFFGLTAIFAMLAAIEYTKLSTPDSAPIPMFVDALATILLVLAPTVFFPQYDAIGLFCVLGFVACLVLRAVITLFDEREAPFLDLCKSALGIMYVGLPLCLLNTLYVLFPEANYLVLCMFILIWLNDTGAFCFGSLLGKHRLCERLSPKKSWEGFWGGMLCCIGFSVAAFFIFGMMEIWQWILFGLLVCVFSTWGDLLESLIKRSMHVKDSGHLIPGHGGILDRIDSLLLVAPVSWLFAFVISTI